MKIENKLLLYIFLVPIIGMIIGMSGGMYLLKYSSNLSKIEGAKFLKQREIKLQKENLQVIVNSVIHDISILHLSNKNYLQKIKELYPPKTDKYIFIYKVYDLKGGKEFAKMVLNSNKPSLEGKIISDDYKDIKGFAFRKKMLELIRKNGEAFVSYFYKKPNSHCIKQKISYFKYYKPLNIIVASGIYLDDIEVIISKYHKHLDKFNDFIIQKFIIISTIIFIITLIFTFIISRIILKEFNKFRNTIKLNEKKLKYKLYVDELTKLKSRKALVEDIEHKRFNCLLLVDIDNFRNINQFFGAEIGDKYLKEFATILKKFRKTIKESIMIYRVGSDEFAIGIKNSDYDNTKQIAKQLLEFCCLQKIEIQKELFDVDITVVFSNFPTPLQKALVTLSYAKQSNKNLLCYKHIKDINKEKEFFEIKKMLKTAIEKDQIQPYAQAIVNDNQEIIKYELLMRIVTPQKVIPPYFLDYAKKAKLYTQISSIMIKKCFEFIKNCDVLCSINIDMQDIENEDILASLKAHVQYIQKPVVIEILESESFKNYDKLKSFISEFKKYGVLFAIDDFGSGYSNYSEVLELKPNYLKLDGSLIKNINNSRENLIVIESILFLTKMIGIKTTAEFVENEEIFKKLRALGIDEFQGYYFSKPMPLSELKLK